jgi:hypothetical protein
MRNIVADQIEQGVVIQSRTFRGVSAHCRTIGSESAPGNVEIVTHGGFMQNLAVSKDARDFQRIWIFDGEQLLECLEYAQSIVVHSDRR